MHKRKKIRVCPKILSVVLTLIAALSIFGLLTACQKNAVLSFDTLGGSNVQSISVAAGAQVNAPNTVPSKEGVLFDGWFLDRELTLQAEFPLILEESLTLFAKYRGKSMISFDSCGGSEVEPITGFRGDYIGEPIAPTKQGYRFDGWFTAIDYKLPYDFYDGRQIPEADITLFAKWTKVFELSFETEGAGQIQSIVLEAGETIFAPSNPTKTGYVFEGWYANDVKFVFDTMPQSNVVLTAKWRASATNITITFQNGNATIAKSGLNEGDTLVPPQQNEFTNTGIKTQYYLFAGWFTDSGDKFDFEGGVPSQSIQLSAKWIQKAEFALIVFVQNGNEIDRLYVQKNTVLTGSEMTEEGKTASFYSLSGTIYSNQVIEIPA